MVFCRRCTLKHLEKLLSLERGQFLTEEELAILKWGADYGHESRRRHSGVEHRDASALEALVAYLYLFDGTRLTEGGIRGAGDDVYGCRWVRSVIRWES